MNVDVRLSNLNAYDGSDARRWRVQSTEIGLPVSGRSAFGGDRFPPTIHDECPIEVLRGGIGSPGEQYGGLPGPTRRFKY